MTKKKSILIFMEDVGLDDERPFSYDLKRDTYLSLCNRIFEKGFDLFISKGFNSYLGHNSYKTRVKFEGGEKFTKTDEIVNPYRVLDRSPKALFPSFDQDNVINNLAIKLICRNKWHTFMMFREYSPKTYFFAKLEKLKSFILSKDENFVLKPMEGTMGDGISIISKDTINSLQDDNLKTFIVQEFVDSSIGIPGIVDGKHDLRIVYVGGNALWAHVRTPGEGEFRANVAQGGSISSVPISIIPTGIMNMSNSIANKVLKLGINSCFSIDIANTKSGPKIYELNSTIGFPSFKMEEKDLFVNTLVKMLTI